LRAVDRDHAVSPRVPAEDRPAALSGALLQPQADRPGRVVRKVVVPAADSARTFAMVDELFARARLPPLKAVDVFLDELEERINPAAAKWPGSSQSNRTAVCARRACA
jgi:hypothetical protein